MWTTRNYTGKRGRERRKGRGRERWKKGRGRKERSRKGRERRAEKEGGKSDGDVERRRREAEGERKGKSGKRIERMGRRGRREERRKEGLRRFSASVRFVCAWKARWTTSVTIHIRRTAPREMATPTGYSNAYEVQLHLRGTATPSRYSYSYEAKLHLREPVNLKARLKHLQASLKLSSIFLLGNEKPIYLYKKMRIKICAKPKQRDHSPKLDESIDVSLDPPYFSLDSPFMIHFFSQSLSCSTENCLI